MMKYFGPKKCYFFDGTSTTGAGLLDYLFAHPNIQYILIDEIDKMKKNDQVVLLNLMETGMLILQMSFLGMILSCTPMFFHKLTDKSVHGVHSRLSQSISTLTPMYTKLYR